MKLKSVLHFISIMALPFLASCGAGSGKGHDGSDGDTIALRHARNLTMVDYGGYTRVDFRNPWDTARTLQTLILVPSDKPLPANLLQGTVLRTPLQKSIVYTSVHGGLIEELGAVDAIAGVCDAKYQQARGSELSRRISSGEVADCGESMAPNIERILMLNPDAILLSAYENSNDHNKVGQIGIPIIDCPDYMEASPLGRAEWMKFYGRIYGKGELADSIFNATEKAYLGLKASVEGLSEKPSVLFDLIYGQSWSMPGAYSTTGVMIEDAGGKNPFDKYKKSGGVMLAPEEALYTAKDADIWLIRYMQDKPLTLSQLGGDNPIYTKFKPYAEASVYGCNTLATTYFDDAAFHPHWILAEYISLFHPELGQQEYNHGYFKKLEN